MAGFLQDRMGASHTDVDEAGIARILAELDQEPDGEHPDVVIVDESGWSLAAHQSGLVVWENVEEDSEPRHMAGVPRDRVRELFRFVAAGQLGPVEAEPWQPGYG